MNKIIVLLLLALISATHAISSIDTESDIESCSYQISHNSEIGNFEKEKINELMSSVGCRMSKSNDIDFEVSIKKHHKGGQVIEIGDFDFGVTIFYAYRTVVTVMLKDNKNNITYKEVGGANSISPISFSSTLANESYFNRIGRGMEKAFKKIKEEANL